MRKPTQTNARPPTVARGKKPVAPVPVDDRLPKAVRIVRRRLGGRGWEVVRPESKQPSATMSTQDEAVARGRELLANVGGGQLLVKDDKGTTLSTERVEPVRRVR